MPIGTRDPRGQGIKQSTLVSGGQMSRSLEAVDRFEGLAEASFSPLGSRRLSLRPDGQTDVRGDADRHKLCNAYNAVFLVWGPHTKPLKPIHYSLGLAISTCRIKLNRISIVKLNFLHVALGGPVWSRSKRQIVGLSIFYTARVENGWGVSACHHSSSWKW